MAAWRAEPGGGTPGIETRAGAHGFSLVEVLVALVVLQIGLLGVAGIMRLAVAELAVARRVEAAQWAASAMADSLVAGRVAAGGARDESWGTLRWAAVGPGVLVEGVRDPSADVAPMTRIWVAGPAWTESPP